MFLPVYLLEASRVPLLMAPSWSKPAMAEFISCCLHFPSLKDSCGYVVPAWISNAG